jgi:putative component of membrane protein insertase Oxa1/YidC/SpoIIIJ protein YidD
MTFLIFSRSLGKIIAFTFFLLQITIYHQTDWIRWDKSDPTYQIQDTYLEREYDFTIESVSDVFVKPVMNTYLFFISDVDGANCPFHPSCSSFLMQSIKETNLLQGTFMFFDRFTRDINVFGRHEHYPKYSKNHFYDPVSLYTLDERKINYIPANSFIDE